MHPLRSSLAAVFLALACSTGSAQAGETRFFVSTAGTLLEAELVSAAGENVTLRRKEDGRELTVVRATLCKEDHAYIDAWLARTQPDGMKSTTTTATPAPAAVSGPKFSLTANVRSNKSNRGDTFSRTVTLSYNVQLQSREVSRDLTGAKGVLITLAKDASAGDDRLYVLQKVEFDVNLRAQGKMEHASPAVKVGYTIGAAGDRVGVKEHGYVLVVTDAAGNMQLADSSPAGNEKYAKEVLALTAPCVVDRSFQVKADASLPGGIELNP